jgi:transcriptional regulator with PAS, ATPase and Fis domain
MAKIAIFVPDRSRFDIVKKVVDITGNDIEICEGSQNASVEIARDLANRGVEVIIARGRTADLIRQSGIGVYVIDLPITGFDLIKAVEQAKAVGRNIAVVTFARLVKDIECLSPILDISLKQYPITIAEDAEPEVLRAFHEGADVVLGGFVTAQAATKHGFPHVSIQTSEQSISQALSNARNALAVAQQEKARSGFIHTILEFTYDGIVSIDKEYRITSFNPIASKLCKISDGAILGKDIRKVWPKLKLDEVVDSQKEQLQQLLIIHDKQIVCNKVPILVHGTVVGAVATFQETTRIQSIEAFIRRETYARGHLARYTFDDILGKSPGITQTIKTAKNYARTESSILILGETGSGKEVFAQSIHNDSNRKNGPFIAINCAALPSQLLESEFFGYVSGAFTGARKEGKPGLFEAAHNGTIFLDEISEMDYFNQGRLLRVLQERAVVRLGSDKVIPINVRIITATNKNIEELVEQKKFRDDLYYRLNVLRLSIPPLRERKRDIGIYVTHFLSQHSSKKHYRIGSSALRLLENYKWPGNVRELANSIERLIATHDKETISANNIVQLIGKITVPKSSLVFSKNAEADVLIEALKKTHGNQAKAAIMLGISRTTLWRKMNKYQLNITISQDT